jgi:Uncharacterised protein family (UPF0149)
VRMAMCRFIARSSSPRWDASRPCPALEPGGPIAARDSRSTLLRRKPIASLVPVHHQDQQSSVAILHTDVYKSLGLASTSPKRHGNDRRPITRSSEALGMIERSLLQTGLSEQDLDELSDFLELRCLPEGGMDIWMLDGYLTAIVSGPELIPPGEWLPRIWGEREGDKAAVVSEHLHVLILRRMNEISRDFRDGAANPLFLWKEDDGKKTMSKATARVRQHRSLPSRGAWVTSKA